MSSTIRSIMPILIFILFSGCASLPDEKSLEKHAMSVISSSNTNTSSYLQKAKLRIKKANTESLEFYAPSYFQRAKKDYQEALKLYKNKEGSNEIKSLTQLTIEYVNSGLRNKKIVLDTLKASIKHRKILIALKAKQHLPKEFKKVESAHLELIKLIEQRELDEALKEETSLLKSMRQLEVKTIGFTHLSAALRVLNKAKEMGAIQLLPKTYQQTITTLEETQQYIRQNPREKSHIKKYADKTLYAMQRLFVLSRHAKRLTQLKEDNIETFTLNQEEQLKRISQALKRSDMLNISFNDQSLALTEAIKKTSKKPQKVSKKASKASSKKDMEKWKRKVVLLQAEVRRLRKAQN